MFFIVLIASIFIPRTMANVDVISIIPYVLISIIGFLMVFSVSAKFVGKFRAVMIYIGNHTLPLLTWHFLSFKLVRLLIIWVENRPIEQLAYFSVIPPANCADQLYSVGFIFSHRCAYSINILLYKRKSYLKKITK